jgi:hypothetical protein
MHFRRHRLAVVKFGSMFVIEAMGGGVFLKVGRRECGLAYK